MSDITLGIIGSGQLGSLLCQAAKKLNVNTVVISDDEQGPAQNYSNEFIYSKYDDENKVLMDDLIIKTEMILLNNSKSSIIHFNLDTNKNITYYKISLYLSSDLSNSPAK